MQTAILEGDAKNRPDYDVGYW